MARRKIKSLAELREIGNHVVQAAKNALKESADLVVEDAKSRVPVDTGALRDSIQAKASGSGSSFKISANAKSSKGYAYGRKFEYAPVSEKRFLHPALFDNQQTIINKINNAVKNAINN